MVPRVSAPFSMNFMLPVPEASLEARRDLLGQVAGGDELFGGGDVVVLHKHHLQPLGHLRVCGDDLGQGQQGVDDVLGDGVGRGGLGAEDADQRGSRGWPALIS